MNAPIKTVRSLAYGMLLPILLAACGGGTSSESALAATVAPVAITMPSSPPPMVHSDAGLPDAIVRLIETDHSAAPELKEAAVGYATATLVQWQAGAVSHSYDETLALKTLQAEVCLVARSERLGRPFTLETLAQFKAALASTPELYAAKQESDQLQIGKVLVFANDETTACAKASGL
jgi:hypothetical protein